MPDPQRATRDRQREGEHPVSPPPLGRRAANKARRRAELLTVADKVIASSGLRASVAEIADAAGILPGSLYHHFESKEAILVELVKRYHDDLDRLGDAALEQLDDPDPRRVPEQLIALGKQIAECAVAHRAALHMSFYEGPSSDPALNALTHRRPTKIQDAVVQTLRVGRWNGGIRSDLDLAVVADRFCQTMLHSGLDVIRHSASSEQLATMMCQIILKGLATNPPSDSVLNQSAAFAAADEIINTWVDDDADKSKADYARAVARAEFGRRGYEVTTIRDIAAAADLGTGTVYRLIGSKEEILMSIMLEFGTKVGEGWTNVLKSNSTSIEKLDALSWINICALDRFPDEFRIQLAWMRQSPPDTPQPAAAYATRVKQARTLLKQAIQDGDINFDGSSTEGFTRCVIGMQWIPENIAQEIGVRRALVLARDTVLRGVMERGSASRRD